MRKIKAFDAYSSDTEVRLATLGEDNKAYALRIKDIKDPDDAMKMANLVRGIFRDTNVLYLELFDDQGDVLEEYK